MSSDTAVAINWTLVVLLVFIVGTWFGTWHHPASLRKISARYLARAEALDLARRAYDKALLRWHKQLGIPEAQQQRAKELSAAEAKS